MITHRYWPLKHLYLSTKVNPSGAKFIAIFKKLNYSFCMYHKSLTHTFAILMIIALLQMLGCSKGQEKAPKTKTSSTQKVKGCQGCHQVSLDRDHQLSCTICHGGNEQAASREAAHTGMIASPASPEQMSAKCGKCHHDIVNSAAHSTHFTLRKAVNMVRRSFGAKDDLASLTDIPTLTEAQPSTPLNLADDMLRRRCLRCHLYYSGDPYPATRHGLGCAACHLAYEGGKLVSHQFIRQPGDKQCLSCHYGNFVGADYYGRFEHDYNWEYRTPFSAGDDSDMHLRPYGIRYHQLTPDIHRQNGLLCIDCHPGSQLMSDKNKGPTCRTCHLHQSSRQPLPANLHLQGGKLWLTTKDGRRLPVPQAVNPAHRYDKKAACQVCHAQWSFGDQGIYLMRQDSTDDFEEWHALTRQGDFEVERQVEANLFGSNGDDGAIMTDKITGREKRGIWLKSYELRRWEPVLICRDRNGILQVCRGILDLHLSFVNRDNKDILDDVTPLPKVPLLPYTPHTTGKAGAFFKQRLQITKPQYKDQTRRDKQKSILAD